MITQNKEREKVSQVIETTVRTRDGERLEYVLYKDENSLRSFYSIQALQYKNGIKVCQATACDVSGVYRAAKDMFDMIADGYVEPYLLCDVVCDLLP